LGLNFALGSVSSVAFARGGVPINGTQPYPSK
jgi:hypothetical protein